MGLTKKRRLVLANYTSDPDCTLDAALVKAGYSKKRAKITAIELRKDPEFIAAIERRQSQKLDKLERGELSDQEVIDGIRDVEEECKLQGPVAAYLTIRLKAHEMLAKIRGMYIEKIEFGFGAELAKEIAAARARAQLPAPILEGALTQDKPNQC
jgi:hypothetical protein